MNQNARLALYAEDEGSGFSAPIAEEDQRQHEWVTRVIFTEEPHTGQDRSKQKPRICTGQGAMEICMHVSSL